MGMLRLITFCDVENTTLLPDCYLAPELSFGFVGASSMGRGAVRCAPGGCSTGRVACGLPPTGSAHLQSPRSVDSVGSRAPPPVPCLPPACPTACPPPVFPPSLPTNTSVFKVLLGASRALDFVR